jgi:hypothetical protein
MLYCITKFHIHTTNGSLIFTIKSNRKVKFDTLLFYILHNNCPIKSCSTWDITTKHFRIAGYPSFYRAFNQGGKREESVEPEQHFSRIAALTADNRMSH